VRLCTVLSLFTGLSRSDLDLLNLMFLMVVVVAAVDAVHNVSLSQSEPFRECAYPCVEQKITRGGSWDQQRAQRPRPPIVPTLAGHDQALSTKLSPLVCLAKLWAAELADGRTSTSSWRVEDRLPPVISSEMIESAARRLLLDSVGQLSDLVEHAAAFCHQGADLAISVHHGRMITSAELLSDLG
jgi:hypothetical protein